MNCTPQSLLEASKCFCFDKKTAEQVAIYLLCQWANHLEPAGCGNQGPEWIRTPTLVFTGDLIGIQVPLEIPPPPPYDTQYCILYWGTNPGGPYPNNLTVPLANIADPFALLPSPVASNFTINVATYFVVRSFDTMDHCSDLSAEVFHVFAAPGSVTPVWTPTTEQVTWTDTNGTFLGDLATFEHNVSVASLTNMTFGATGNLTSLTGLQSAPNLAVLDVNTNALTSLDCHGLASLTNLNCSSNASLTTLTLTGCTGIATLNCTSCGLTTLDVSVVGASLNTLSCAFNSINNGAGGLVLTGCTGIANLDCHFNSISSIDCSGLSSLFTFDASSNTGPLVSIDFTNCTSLTNLDLNSASGYGTLISVVLSGCSSMVNCGCVGNNITSLDIGASVNYSSLDASNNSLSLASTDDVLSKLKTNCLANAGICDLTGGTNSAPTLACGNPASDCFALNAAGWTATTN